MEKISDNKKEKLRQVAELEKIIKDSSSVVIWEYLGLKVVDIENIKNEFAEVGAFSKVYKNRLAKIAFKNLGYESLSDSLVGSSAFAFTTADETATSRILKKYVKKHDFVNFKAGIFEGKIVDQSELTKIANLPDRNGLYSMFLSTLQGSLRKLMYGLKEVSEQKKD